MPAWFKFGGPRAPPRPASADSGRDSVEVLEEDASLHDNETEAGTVDSVVQRLMPRQFKESRWESLHITPSERDLYLAAVERLDGELPPLPLFADQAPEIPELSLPRASIPPIDVTYPESHVFDGSQPVTANEWRLSESHYSKRHALLAIAGPSTIRLHAFSAAALLEVDEALAKWSPGIAAKSESTENLRRRKEDTSPVSAWKAELKSHPWKQKSSGELESIRLILAIFTALGQHGWSLVGDVRASSGKLDTHNFVFAYCPTSTTIPPLFFAVTFPQPDRISLVSPPPRFTVQLVDAVRNAIVHGTPTSPPGADTPKLKEEGWHEPGVYRFWMSDPNAGAKRDFLSRLGRTRLVKLAPRLQAPVVISIIDSLMELHFDFVGSVPLLPQTHGRDILIFSSLPFSGLSARDAFVPPEPVDDGSLADTGSLRESIAHITASFHARLHGDASTAVTFPPSRGKRPQRPAVRTRTDSGQTVKIYRAAPSPVSARTASSGQHTPIARTRSPLADEPRPATPLREAKPLPAVPPPVAPTPSASPLPLGLGPPPTLILPNTGKRVATPVTITVAHDAIASVNGSVGYITSADSESAAHESDVDSRASRASTIGSTRPPGVGSIRTRVSIVEG
ncbi:hypothetical protein Q8F55_003964 [Vanrija albida]|uniref:Uncharacterized protein n=1 Tax=Vanrija albida TaxID=181172 RepID=A0ABR3Q5F6_9TREE